MIGSFKGIGLVSQHVIALCQRRLKFKTQLIHQYCGLWERQLCQRRLLYPSLTVFLAANLAYFLPLPLSLSCIGTFFVLSLFFFGFRRSWIGRLIWIISLCLSLLIIFRISINEHTSLNYWSERTNALASNDNLEIKQGNDSPSALYSGEIVSFSELEEGYELFLLRLNNGVVVAFFSDRSDLNFGTLVEISGTLSIFDPQRNPGGFNQRDYYKRKGIYLQLECRSKDIKILGIPASKNILAELTLWGRGFRNQTSLLWQQLLPREEAALLLGMLLGDTQLMSSEQKFNFKYSNLSHLTAVSGAHIHSFLFPISALVRRITKRRFLRYILLAATLLTIGFITGWSAAVSRALWMYLIDLFYGFNGTRPDRLGGLFAATLGLGLVNPYNLLDIGFILSFSATLSLIVGVKSITIKVKKLPFFKRVWIGQDKVIAWLASFICVQVGMLPWLFLLSSRASIAVLLANVIGSCFFTIIIQLALPLVIVLPLIKLFPMLLSVAQILYLPLSGLLLGFNQSAAFLGRRGLAGVRIDTLSPFIIAAILIWGLSLWLPKSFLASICKPIMVLTLATGLIRLNFASPTPLATIIFADVGQGDSTLILAGDRSLLLDAGKDGSGDKVILPLMNYYGIWEPDISILTHWHRDHGGGFIELIKQNRLSQLWASPFEKSPDHEEENQLFTDISSKTILHPLEKNDKIYLTSEVQAEIIYPPTAPNNGGNEASIIVLLRIKAMNFLFMADAGWPTEEEILADLGKNGTIDQLTVLRVGHHGSRFSSSSDFLYQMKPEVAIISVGNNLYGHPALATLEALNSLNIKTWRTDESGAIVVEVYSEDLTVRECIE